MKKFLFLLTLVIYSCTAVNAQQQLTRHKTLLQPELQPQMQTGLEDLPAIPLQNSSSTFLQKFNLNMEELVGMSTYGLQTNSAVQNRLHNYGNGELSAVWTFGAEPNAPNRGTGYNRRTADGWGESPSMRLEADLRTGWPSLNVTDDGTEVIICHASPPPYKLHVLQNTPSSGGRFIESDIPSDTPVGLLWPRTAASGQTVHAIAITTPLGLGGELVNGINGALLYFRSSDAGLTWDIIDAPIEGINSDFYGFISADSYDIHARGDVVAITVGTGWGDVALIRSEDRGETWEKTIIRDFPLDGYQPDQGYTIDDLGGYDGNPFDSLAINTADGAINVLLDNNNMAHVVFGEMYVADVATEDGQTQFYPGSSGLSYWNENMDSTKLIYDLVDVNGNDTLDILGIPSSYGTSMTSHASMGIDADNNLYIALGAMLEDFNNEEVSLGYRHVLVMTSTDNGETFGEPLDIVIEEASFAEDIFFAVEGTYPSVAKHVDNKMRLLYQVDFLPGHSVGANADHEPTDNFIVYQAIDRADIPNADVSSTETVATTDFAFELSPNPATERVQLTYTLKEKAAVQIRVTDMLGREVKRFNYNERARGLYNLHLQTTGLEVGMYLIQLQIGQQIATQKLMVK